MKISYSILLLAFFVSCTKDKVPIPVFGNIVDEDCYEPCIVIPEIEGNSYGYNYYYDSTYHNNPQFNPENDNEIVFIDGTYSLGYQRIVKYNLVSQVKTIVHEGFYHKALAWAKDDWIIFHDQTNNKLSKIKSDGSNLTELAHNYWFPQVNWEGDKILTHTPGSEKKSTIFNLEGEIIGTIENWETYYSSWNHPYYYGGVKDNKLTIFNSSTLEIVLQETLSDADVSTFTWASLNTIIYNDKSGVILYNIDTKEKKRIRCYCNAYFYSFATHNKSFTKLLFSKGIHTIMNPQLIHEDSKIVIMNTDGSNEQEIVIP